MDRASEEKGYEKLSPFELKNKLISMAKDNREVSMLNAGRGNPNWISIAPRAAFFQFGMFALEESMRTSKKEGLGGSAQTEGLLERFKSFLSKQGNIPGIDFLNQVLEYIHKSTHTDTTAFLVEMVDGILGDHYPMPDRMLTISEQIVRKYLELEMLGGNASVGKFELFATEGGTAAMDYVFNSLFENKILKKGDKIALGTPIFTPYIEIPRLNDYELVEVLIEQDEESGWQYPDSEIEKLEDPAIKAFFLVNPSNPTSVSMRKQTLDKITNLVKTKRKDLIVLTDDVYGTFVEGFRSLAAAAPHNTILVYSFSKYFGTTGCRLGVIGIHEDNIFDEHISKLSDANKKILNKRYSTVTIDPSKMKFIDRIVADSRAVALNHTAGLSTLQQVLMVMLSLQGLMDTDSKYKNTVRGVVAHRFKTLYEAMDLPCPDNAYGAHYYTTIDIPRLAQKKYSREFAEHLLKSYEPIDFVWRLANEKSIVLMDGGGFDAPEMSVRVSLANLPDEAYSAIGKGIVSLLEDYHNKWQSLNK